MMHVFESLLAFVVRGHPLRHAIVYNENARVGDKFEALRVT